MSEITLKINLPENLETILQAILNGQPVPPTTAPVGDEIWTIEDICKAYKWKKSKVYSMTMQTGPGSLPRFKVGRDSKKRSDRVV